MMDGWHFAAAKLKAILFVAVSIGVTYIKADNSCQKLPKSNCACSYNGFILDLGAGSSNPKWSASHNGTDYKWSPCQPFFPPRNTSILFKINNETVKNWNDIGREQPEIVGIPEKSLVFKYPRQGNRTGLVKIMCHAKATSSTFMFISVKNNTGVSNYTFSFEGPEGCLAEHEKPVEPKKQLSAGSILLILFFVGVALYLIVGLAVNKCIRGARGIELIPNYEFWRDLPSLVKEGFCFAINCGCREDRYQGQTYDNI